MFGEKYRPRGWGLPIQFKDRVRADMNRLDAAGILPEEIDHIIYKNYNCSHDDLMWSIWLEGAGDSLISNYVSDEIVNMTNASTFSVWIDCNWNELPPNWLIVWDNFYDDDDYVAPAHILS